MLALTFLSVLASLSPAIEQRMRELPGRGDLHYLGGNKQDFNAGEHDFHLGFAVDLNDTVADLKDVQEDAEGAEQQQ